MSEDEFLASITVRMSYAMNKELISKSGKGTQFRDKSEAIRSFIGLGMKIDTLMKQMNDPEKKAEFENKLKFLVKEKDLEKQMETMDEEQLNLVIYMASNLKEKKVEQLLLDIKQS